jgi:hypothetical protein
MNDKQPEEHCLSGDGLDRPPQIAHRVSFPLIKGTRPALAGPELTPERIAAILLAEEAAHALRLAGFDVNEEELLADLLNEARDT